VVILPDVNVLVYAFRREAPGHERYASWLAELRAGADELALHDLPLSGFVRVVTNPRITANPASAAVSLDFVSRLRSSSRTRWLPAGMATWQAFGQIVATDRQVRGNLVPDGFLAALAIANGARLATTDRGMARFAGLEWFDPGET
jgi:toxin-antitoxin system PIN domain toxin